MARTQHRNDSVHARAAVARRKPPISSAGKLSPEQRKELARIRKSWREMSVDELEQFGFDLEEEMMRRGCVAITFENSGDECVDGVRRRAALREFNRRHEGIDLSADEVTFIPVKAKQNKGRVKA